MSTFTMADNPLRALRSGNLRKLGLSAQELRDMDPKSREYSYWQGLLNGSRSFGEKIAREIEDLQKLDRYDLDDPEFKVAKRAASPFAELRPHEAAFLQLYRVLGNIGGREEQDAAATRDLGAASTEPTATMRRTAADQRILQLLHSTDTVWC